MSEELGAQGADVVQEYVNSQELGDAIAEKAAVEGESHPLDELQPDTTAELEVEASKENSEPAEEKDPFSAKFAALSRKEKAIRERELQMEQRYQELEEKFKELEANQAPKVEEPVEEPIESLLRKNPLEALKKFGWDYDKLTQMTLEDGKLPTDIQMQLMRDELENKYQQELESLRNEIVKDKEERENEKYQQVINNYMTELNDFVDQNSDNYEFIKANDAVDLVYEVIEEHYGDTGRILDKQEAADLVEQYLEEEFRERIAKTSKAKKFLAPQEVKEQVIEKRQSPPTLSNAHAATASPKAERKLSEDESKAKAASLLKWTE